MYIIVIVNVNVNSRFLQRQKSEVAGTSLFTGAYPKSIGNGSDPESPAAGRQRIRRLWWMVFGGV